MKRTREEAEKTRQNILASARQVFCNLGYNDTTMEEIARQAGVTRGAVYWHFDNKLDILLQMTGEDVPGIMYIAMDYLGRPGDPLDRITGLFRYLVTNLHIDQSVKNMTNIFTMLKDHPKELNLVRNIIMEHQRPVNELFYRVISEGIRCNSLRSDVSPEAIMTAFRFVIQGLWDMIVTFNTMVESRIAKEITEMLISAIGDRNHARISGEAGIPLSCQM